MSLSFELELAIDEVAMAFGWKNARKLWIETRGFKTNLESAIKDYPNSGLVQPKKLAEYIRLMKEFTSPYDEIMIAMDRAISDLAEGGGFTCSEEAMGDLAYGYEESEDGEALKKKVDEQAWENFKNSRDYEHIEASGMEKRGKIAPRRGT